MALNINVTSQNKELEGVEFDFPYADGVKFRIARAQNMHHKRKLNQLRGSFSSIGAASPEDEEKMLIRSLPGTVVLGWSGVKDGDTEVVYSDEECLNILLDPRSRDLLEWILRTATNINNYRVQKTEELGKS